MKNEVMSFRSEKFGMVRSITIGGEAWFVAGDIADSLGYRNAPDMTRFLDEDEKGTQKVRTHGGIQNVTVVNESGMYHAVIKSKKPEAKRFRKWITQDVLPSIRNHGAYLSDDALELFKKDPNSIYRLANAVVEEHSARLTAERKVAELEPKAAFYDSAMTSKTTLKLTDVAHILDLPYGNVTLVKKLRDIGILKADNTPLQEYINRGYFCVKERQFNTKGGVKIIRSTRVYQSGLDFILRKLK